MDPFQLVHNMDIQENMRFFHRAIRRRPNVPGPEEEVRYVASVLAHHALTSTSDTTGAATPATLSSVFDQFINLGSAIQFLDSNLCETAGSQILFLGGLFRDGIVRRGRHNLRWYYSLGSSFYEEAAKLSGNPKRGKFLFQMSQTFNPWANFCGDMYNDLCDDRFLLPPIES